MPYLYKTKSEVTDFDTKNYQYLIKGIVPDEPLDLIYSREVARESVARSAKRHQVFYNEDTGHNRPSARKSRDQQRILPKGIQLYRHWFQFLKLAIELEKLKVELVIESHNPRITNWTIADIPPEVIERAKKERQFTDGVDAIFRCKVIQRIKVQKARYRGWDLDQVLESKFNDWWETHSHLFEGHAPKFIDSKNDWIDSKDVLYVQIDRQTQWRDIQAFMRDEVSKKLRKTESGRYKIEGSPRVNVLQNNYNALVLLLKGWNAKEICTADKVYLRSTDVSEFANRSETNRLTVPHNKDGQPLYSALVSKQRNMGVHHLLEVCAGRFGSAPGP